MRIPREDSQLVHQDVRSRQAMSIHSKRRAMHRLTIQVLRLYQQDLQLRTSMQTIPDTKPVLGTDTNNTPAMLLRDAVRNTMETLMTMDDPRPQHVSLSSPDPFFQ